MLAGAGAVALLDGGENADHGEHRREHVGDRNADPHRRLRPPRRW